jgi:integrative and conjugative element protein (TIGR02256 family)
MQSSNLQVPLCFALPSGERLFISLDVQGTMNNYKQTGMFSREAGGQLFAKIGDKEISIVHATTPGLFDLRSRFGFRPNRKTAQLEIDKHYKQGLHFVGEWHTHPEAHPTPSGSDLESMLEMVTISVHALSGYIMLIVGTAEDAKSIHASIHFPKSWVNLVTCNSGN